MKPFSIILTGPANSGKTENAEAIKKHYGMSRIVDDWDGETTLKHGTLAITRDAREDWVRDPDYHPVHINRALEDLASTRAATATS
ncbi:hypothetical protein [Sphingomonas immobilis]|uniref:Uncharacterized protein n=1 Tax=Sphingomonas immobilis TaxID=3063997 RepID=A0ABT9A0V8_9SPHN|nr:hypothetical protein [Sphingomonas sp. CA1-15]MDO7843466.1 hypothetical protein [Sphingomonas sp. CA1-15]